MSSFVFSLYYIVGYSSFFEGNKENKSIYIKISFLFVCLSVCPNMTSGLFHHIPIQKRMYSSQSSWVDKALCSRFGSVSNHHQQSSRSIIRIMRYRSEYRLLLHVQESVNLTIYLYVQTMGQRRILYILKYYVAKNIYWLYMFLAAYILAVGEALRAPPCA